MRIAIFLFLFFFSAKVFAQSGIETFLDSAVIQLKSQSNVDKNDFEVFTLLERFYNEALQSDKGELSQKTVETINGYRTNNKIKNWHLLILFLMYQDHISQTAAKGKQPNGEFQIACIQRLESEMQSLYKKTPVIVYIYKAEALESAGRRDDAKAFVAASLQKVPNSIPLKVYRYLDSKDEEIRKDLVQNHSTHWMVQQFGIK
jgi:hypothetical protein